MASPQICSNKQAFIYTRQSAPTKGPSRQQYRIALVGPRSLVGCSPWNLEESDTTERLHLQFSLSCTGKGNGSPLQCSCLENPRDGGAWWAAIYGVAQSRTRLQRLSSSSAVTLQNYSDKITVVQKYMFTLRQNSWNIEKLDVSAKRNQRGYLTPALCIILGETES